MLPLEIRRTSLLSAGSLVMTILAGCVMRMMPYEVATIIAVWTLLSVPLGIAVGHCFPAEE